VLSHGGAAALVAVKDDGEILLVKQFREAAEAEILEIPAGRLDRGEAPAACAARELEEETGYRAGKIRELISFYPAVGYSGEKVYIYLAEELTPGERHLDEGEFVDAISIPLPDAIKMIKEGKIIDGKTITALLYYVYYLK
jgi:ADP-ribose pyrophosphatase